LVRADFSKGERVMRRLVTLVVLVGLAVGTCGCGGGTTTAPPADDKGQIDTPKTKKRPIPPPK
jgi:hypothetical protein